MAILLFLATCAWWPAARQAGPVAASPIVHVEVASRSALGASGSLEISPDGRWLFLGGTSSPQLIDLRTRRRSSLERVFAPDRAWGLDPQGRFCLVARASDGIEVWQPGVPGTTALQRVTGEALAIGGFAADGSSFLAFVVRDSALPDPERPWGHLRHQVLVSVATADWSPEWELTLGEAEPFMPARPSLLYRDPARRFVLLALRQSLFAIDLASRSAKELPLQGGPGDEGLDWVTGAFLKVQSDELCLVSK